MSTQQQNSEFEGLATLIATYRTGEANFQETPTELKRALADVASFEMPDIRDEMDGDMDDSYMPQGEIESCLNHWDNKYYIFRK